jgi:hypothetical protein
MRHTLLYIALLDQTSCPLCWPALLFAIRPECGKIIGIAVTGYTFQGVKCLKSPCHEVFVELAADLELIVNIKTFGLNKKEIPAIPSGTFHFRSSCTFPH